MNEKFCISIHISVKFVPKGPIDDNPAWLFSATPLSESHNGVALNRHHAIIWTNADLNHWRIIAAQGDMLTVSSVASFFSRIDGLVLLLDPCLLVTLQNNGWMGIHEFFRMWTEISRSHGSKNRRIWPRLGVSGLELHFEFTNGYEMMHKAWSSIEEVPYCFWRSSVKFEGHAALKSVEFDPNWALPDCNSSLNSPMATK